MNMLKFRSALFLVVFCWSHLFFGPLLFCCSSIPAFLFVNQVCLIFHFNSLLVFFFRFASLHYFLVIAPSLLLSGTWDLVKDNELGAML